jgi:hypothetical protein
LSISTARPISGPPALAPQTSTDESTQIRLFVTWSRR